ncbi:MAG: sigma-70 family RNA polymerase sigma factor [Nocardioidaceae bacterium]
MVGPRSPQPDRDDRAVVAALRAGDESTFASLVDAWSGSMLHVARAFVATDGAAEEVVQDTWLAVLTGLVGFQGRSSLRTWVYRILVNQAKSRGVRDRRVVPFASLATDADDAPAGARDGAAVEPSRFQGPDEPFPGHWHATPTPWPEEAALTREVEHVVADALRGLPPRQRVVVALRDVDAHTAEEVSTLLGITPGNQRVLLHRGRSAVRARLEQYFAGSRAPQAR